MRRNPTQKILDAADFARRENCSFIRLNDAFRKTLLKAAKKNSKTTHYESRVQCNTGADFKLTYRENYGKLWKTFCLRGGGGNKLIAREKLINVHLLWPIRLPTTRLSQRVYKRDFCSHVFANPDRCTSPRKIISLANSLLTLFRPGGAFRTPLRQNRDNSYTERAMSFKFSDFS